METRTYNVYTIDELPEEARQKAINEWRTNDYYSGHDNRDSLDKFSDIMPIKVIDFEYGYGRKNINFKFYDFDTELSKKEIKEDILYRFKSAGIDLKKDYPLTGYYIDDCLLSPIRKFLKKPYNTSYRDLMEECLNEWLYACEADYEETQSEEYILETMRANDYMFTEDGKLD